MNLTKTEINVICDCGLAHYKHNLPNVFDKLNILDFQSLCLIHFINFRINNYLLPDIFSYCINRLIMFFKT